MKIVYVLPTLAWKGGAERIISEKANYLAEHYGYEVTIVTILQSDTQPNVYPLSNQVNQMNLHIPNYQQFKYSYPKRFFVQLKLRNQLINDLTRTVQQIDPDILIGVSYYYANHVCSINCRAKKIIECHDGRQSVISDFIPNNSFLTPLMVRIHKFLYFKEIEKKADTIVTLSSEAKDLWKHVRHVIVIPNFCNMNISYQSDCKNKRIISVGRIDKEKGVDRLIDIWKIVVLKHPDWQLDIFGEGFMKQNLMEIVVRNGINHISFKSHTDNISQEYASSSICVVTSYFEGFSLALVEAMKHGVPCVAFDCPYGPRHIIENNRSGFLVEDGNIELYAQKVCLLIENEELRKQFSLAGIQRSKLFDITPVMKQWKELFEAG